MLAVAFERRRKFARRIDGLIVEQKDPVFEAACDRLHQYRIVMRRDVVQISIELGFAVDCLRKVAARSRQWLEEGASVQRSKIVESIPAFVAFGTQRAVARAQKEIVAAKGGDTGIFKNAVGEIFVGGKRRCGGIVLRI